MSIKSRTRIFVPVLAASMLAATTLSSHAEKWPGTGPAIGSALAARVIGMWCRGTLSPEEIHDLDSYLTKKRLEGVPQNEKDRKFQAYFYPNLEATYVSKYRQTENCNNRARVAAKDIVERVRKDLKENPY